MNFDLGSLAYDLFLIAVAFALAVPLGWEREQAHRPAGLRTFPIVGVASCAFVLVGMGAFPDSPDAQARIFQGLMTGIGFIGGGAILKQSDTGVVRGLTTAASLWTTAAIGAAVAYRRFDLAVVLTLVNFVILHWMKRTKQDDT
jgi:putative Mg2+ transporter-C (MgtC) family protein